MLVIQALDHWFSTFRVTEAGGATDESRKHPAVEGALLQIITKPSMTSGRMMVPVFESRKGDGENQEGKGKKGKNDRRPGGQGGKCSDPSKVRVLVGRLVS